MWNPFARTTRDADSGASSHETLHASDDRAHNRVPVSEVVEVSGQESAPPLNEIARIERIGRITIVTVLASELAQHRGGPELADLLDELVSGGHRQLVFDIQNVTFMDSQCIGSLVHAMNELARQGGADSGIALANPRSAVAHLFRITRLDRVFTICHDVLAAVNKLERRIQEQSR